MLIYCLERNMYVLFTFNLLIESTGPGLLSCEFTYNYLAISKNRKNVKVKSMKNGNI